MASNPRTIVRGPAGTGKTVLAVERARQLSDEGRKVLFLTFNQLLARHLSAGMTHEGRGGNVEVWHAHSLFRDIIGKAGLKARLSAGSESDEFYSHLFPAIFCDAVLESDFPCWDAIVIDEAQDLLTPEYLDAFDLILRDGLRQGNWHMFLDPLQNLYSTDVQAAVSERLRESHPVFDDLWENCRNTMEVAIQTSIISGLSHASDGAAEGK
jgi:superfamily I DNA and RNA helicase